MSEHFQAVVIFFHSICSVLYFVRLGQLIKKNSKWCEICPVTYHNYTIASLQIFDILPSLESHSSMAEVSQMSVEHETSFLKLRLLLIKAR